MNTKIMALAALPLLIGFGAAQPNQTPNGMKGMQSCSASAKIGQKQSGKMQMCPYCDDAIVPDTPTMDNVAYIVDNGKKTAFRCVYCALATAKTMKGNLKIIAPSTKKGAPVILTRTGSSWSIAPSTAVFSYVPGEHSICDQKYRALRTSADFEPYTKSSPLLHSAKMLTFAEFYKKAN